MYQPTTEFKSVWREQIREINTYNNRNEYWLHFFKSQQSSLGFKMSNQKEDYRLNSILSLICLQ
jgi:hypothetical protein